MRLDLIRHPQPLVAPGVCYGRSDIPVDPLVMHAALARLQGRMSGQALVYSSPLQRCLTFAHALSDRLALPPPCIDDRLREMDFGAWEGLSWERIGWAEVSAWERDAAHHRPGDGESVVQMLRRVADCYEGLRAADRDAIIVCHAGTIRLMLAWHAALSAGTAWPDKDGRDIERAAQMETLARQVVQTPQEIAYGALITLEI